MKLANSAFCPQMATNLCSLRKLKECDYFWNTRTNWLSKGWRPVHRVKEIHDQFVLDYKPLRTDSRTKRTAFAAYSSSSLKPMANMSGRLIHLRTGHAGAHVIEHLEEASRGIGAIPPTTYECDACGVSKIKKQVSRKPPDRLPTRPFEEVSIDMHPMRDNSDHPRYILITCRGTNHTRPYFPQNNTAMSILSCMHDHYTWAYTQYGVRWKKVKGDNELGAQVIRSWMNAYGIVFEPSPAHTKEPDGHAERSGGVIGEKARTMRIHANLPEELWPYIIEATCYLYNRLPNERLSWMSPMELVNRCRMMSDGIDGDWVTPYNGNWRAYGCKAYVMKADMQEGREKLYFKLNARADVGYLVGYVASNIFKVWIPHTGKVRTVRDVRFDEDSFYEHKPCSVNAEQVRLLDEVIDSISIEEDQMETVVATPPVWTADEEAAVYPPPVPEETMGAAEVPRLLQDLQNMVIEPLDEESDADSYESLPVEGYETPASSFWGHDEEDDLHTDHFGHVAENPHRAAFVVGRQIKPSSPDIVAATPMSRADLINTFLNKQTIYRKDLPPEPENAKELKGHPFLQQFRQAEKEHLSLHEAMGTYNVIEEGTLPKSQQVLNNRWVYKYKFNESDELVKFKARIVARGDEEDKTSEETYAATLAAKSFRIFMAISAKYDLETKQLDAVNAFINAPLERTVYMQMPAGYRQKGRLWKLNRALYGLRISPLLWQRHLTATFRSLGFKSIAQEPCAMTMGEITVFFYVDDIGLAYPKHCEAEVERLLGQLKQRYQLTGGGEIEWFLGINVIRDRGQKKLWLSQATYIDKIFALSDHAAPIERIQTPITNEELLPNEQRATTGEVTRFQKMTGSLLYAAIITRPDIAFAVSRLTRHNHNPSPIHMVAAERVLHYLKNTRVFAIEYSAAADAFIIASDAAYADNTVDRKSSHGYMMKLFGGAVAWRASKQTTVTLSTTEAELVAVSETAREGIFLSRLLKGLGKKLQQVPSISLPVVDCDNRQTVGLLMKENAPLNTRLRHIDINQHWLRQEVQLGHIQVRWVKTTDMIADGLTKSYTRQQMQHFREVIGLVDIKERLPGF
jgi:hypothetical protein